LFDGKFIEVISDASDTLNYIWKHLQWSIAWQMYNFYYISGNVHILICLYMAVLYVNW